MDTIQRYVALLARSLSFSSIRVYLNAISFLHKIRGYPNPLQDNFILDLGLRGIKRTLGNPTNKKLPITPDILKCIFPQLDFDSVFDIVIWATALVMFTCMLHVSNALCTSQTFDPSHHLTRADIIVKSGQILCCN